MKQFTHEHRQHYASIVDRQGSSIQLWTPFWRTLTCPRSCFFPALNGVWEGDAYNSLASYPNLGQVQNPFCLQNLHEFGWGFHWDRITGQLFLLLSPASFPSLPQELTTRMTQEVCCTAGCPELTAILYTSQRVKMIDTCCVLSRKM